MKLDAARASKAIRERVAEPLGFNGTGAEDEAANGILALGIATMASAIRQVTIERGLDPREFSLFAYGGGGPLHAGDLARELNIPEVIIPLEPGNFSAVGMLVSDARVDEAATFLRSLDEANLPKMAWLFASLEASVTRKLSDGNDASRINMQRMAEVRYRGQKQGLKFAIGDSRTADEIRQRFEAVYARRYGHCDPSAPLEFVSLAVVALAPMQRPDLTGLTTGARKSRGGDMIPGTRSVFFAHLGHRAEAAVFQRRDLAPGFSHSGPAVIEEYGSTTVIGSGDTFRIGTLSEIRVTIGNEGRTS
jgi:N-methylhydantoinase A